MIKVLHIIHWPKSGIVNLVYNQLKASNSDEIEYRIGFLLEDSETTARFNAIGINVSTYDYMYRNVINALRKIKNDITEWQPDIVHTHSFVPGIFIRFLHVFGYQYNIISTIHNAYPYYLKKTFKHYAKTIIEILSINMIGHKVIAVSEYVKNFITKHTRINPIKIEVIYPGIHIKEDVTVLPENKYLKKVIIVGRLDKQKRHDRLLKIWQKVIQIIPEAQLDIVGEGSERTLLQHLIDELHLKNSVRLLGHRNDIPELFNTTAFSVLTSDHEGFGLVIIESFLQKRTVIAYNVGPLKEIIDDSCGILVKPFDVDAFAENVIYLLNNPEIAKSLGENGYNKVKEHFRIERMVDLIEKEYFKIMDVKI
jgi:glycosyltransferase involved in cell wall biosynthesis